MLDFKTYRGISENAPSMPATNNLDAKIDSIVDDFVRDLMADLINPGTAPQRRRGMWDRFKGSMANIWHGRNSQDNPYFWRNKLGDDLGVPAESFRLKLDDYKALRETCNILESQINEALPAGTENLRIVQLIKNAAQKLKFDLKSILASNPGSSPAVAHDLSDDEQFRRLMSGHRVAAHDPVVAAHDPAAAAHDPAAAAHDPAAAAHDPAAAAHDPAAAAEKALASDDPANAPPTTGRGWPDNSGASFITPEDNEAWDKYGGGATEGPKAYCFKALIRPIKSLPWILRIGDPRINVLRSQMGEERKPSDFSKYINPEKLNDPTRCKKKGGKRSLYQKLFDAGRIETHLNPIKSREDLMDRVKILQRTFGGAAPDEENALDAAMNSIDAKGSAASNVVPASTDRTSNANVSPPTPKDQGTTGDERSNTGVMNASRKELSISAPDAPHPTDNTSLSRPGDNQEDGDVRKIKELKSQIKEFIKQNFTGRRRNSLLGDLRNIDSLSEIEDMKSEIGWKDKNDSNSDDDDDFQAEKTTLQYELGASDQFHHPLHKAKYLKALEDARTSEDIEKIRQEMEFDKANPPEDEFDDWNLSDTVALYKNKLKNPIVESKITIDRKKLHSLSAQKKVQYLKECLSNR